MQSEQRECFPETGSQRPHALGRRIFGRERSHPILDDPQVLVDRAGTHDGLAWADTGGGPLRALGANREREIGRRL